MSEDPKQPDQAVEGNPEPKGSTLLREATKILSEAFGALENPRFLTIIRDRHLAKKPKTFPALGREFGVSAARAGQLEKPALEALKDALSPSDVEVLRQAAELLLPTDAIVAITDDLVDAWPEVGVEVSEVGYPLHRVLGWTVGELLEGPHGWVDEGQFLVRPTLQLAKAATEERLRSRADEHGVVPLDLTDSEKTLRTIGVHAPAGGAPRLGGSEVGLPGATVLRLGVPGASVSGASVSGASVSGASVSGASAPRATVPEGEVSAVSVWLEACGIKELDDKLLLDTKTLADYAAGVLSAVEEPLDVEQLLDRFNHSRRRGARSLVNALSGDKRFQRTSRTKWGLTGWENQGYTSIRYMIGQVVDREGGQIPLEDLVEELTASGEVSAHSIATYASAAPYQSADGMVRRAKTPRRQVIPKVGVKRLYRDEDGWVYRIDVTKNHLRGSGSMVSQAVAAALSLTQGERIVFSSEPREHAVSWRGAQPSLGTLRAHLEHLGAQAGDQVLLKYDTAGTFTVSLVPPPKGDGLLDAAALVTPKEATSHQEAVRALTSSLGEVPTGKGGTDQEDSLDTLALKHLAAQFVERGDQDVANLLASTHFG